MLTLRPNLFPETLSLLPPVPKMIFYEGLSPEDWLRRPKLAVVGSRRPTAYGHETTKTIVGELARSGVVIISGLALGLDGLAHRAALDAGGTTIAVLPSGLGCIYPRSHQNLADEILRKGGGLLSEHSESKPPHKYSFIARNRLIAGFSDGILIPEAAKGSGSLHTADFVLDAGLPVMALPGNIYAAMSAGTNQLIKNGAHLVESAEDVMAILGYEPISFDAAKLKNLPAQESRLLELIARGMFAEEDLATELRLRPAVLASSLTMLELSGHIRPQGNGHWVAI